MTTRSRITLLLAAALLAASAAAAGAITDVRFQNTGAAQSNVPVTFGQVFAVGDMKKSDVLVGKLDGATVPLQVDVKATHADGSVRHAVVSAIIPKLAAGATGSMSLSTGGATAQPSGNPGQLLDAGFTASASATIAGVKYSASADQLLKAGAKAAWLAGPVANEWQVSAPLTTAAGVAHPHLTARFAIRYYSAVKKARVDVTIENNWAYEPGPQNFTYDAEILVGGKSVYAKPALTHLNHARWRKVFWWGGDAPAVNVQSNVKYLIATKAVPNYDQSTPVAEALLASYGEYSEPMTIGLATAYMPTTGGRSDIGILPSWSAAYVLTMDQRARNATLGTADLAGSWSSHYRDRATDRPVSLKSFPYMTIAGRSTDTFNPATKSFDSFPGCGGDCTTPYTHDTSHQPGLAYLPYLVTGDYYYLEELQFWAMWNVFSSNPGYRDNVLGLVRSDQARGQAWAMRTLAEAAYVTPDADALKADLVGIMNNNLDWFNATYTNNATANKLGVLVNGYAISYGTTGIAPWQDDFFTAAIGHAADLGFEKAAPLLAWKVKFPIDRMIAPGACWIDATIYSMNVRAAETAPFFATMTEAYVANHTPDFNAMACNSPAMAASLNLKVGEMTGYADSAQGYPSNMQPALAYGADVAGDAGKAAWTVFANRAVKPNYGAAPQFNIVPRGFVAIVKTPATVADAPILTATLVASPTAAGTWAKIGAENASITVPADTIVRYGAGAAWVYAKVSGAFTASNGYFGKDPAVQVVKTVQAFTPAAAAGPVATPPVSAPPVKPGKVTTPSNTKLKGLKVLTLTFFDAAKLTQVKVLTGITPNSKGVFTVSDSALVPGSTYAVLVTDDSGKALDILFPITTN